MSVGKLSQFTNPGEQPSAHVSAVKADTMAVGYAPERNRGAFIMTLDGSTVVSEFTAAQGDKFVESIRGICAQMRQNAKPGDDVEKITDDVDEGLVQFLSKVTGTDPDKVREVMRSRGGSQP